MRAATTTAAGAVLAVLLSAPVTAHQDATFFHVRPLDARANELLLQGWHRSETIRAMIDALEASDLIVHIASDPFLPKRGHLRFVGTTQGWRYLRVSVKAPGSRARVLAVLAHELQHAIEIARAPEVRSERDLEALFSHVGRVSEDGRAIESNAAVAIERRVYAEILGPERRR